MSFGDEPVNAGDLASIQCAVSKGDFPLEITWMFRGEPLNSDQFGYIFSDSGKRVKQLTIESVNAKNAGEYTCVASNAAGSTSSSAILDVNGISILDPTIRLFSLSRFPIQSKKEQDNPSSFIFKFQKLKIN